MNVFFAKGVYICGKEYKDYCVVVDGDRICKVLPYNEAKKNFPKKKFIHLDGYIFPSVIDSHVHLKETAFLITSINASSVKSYEELLELIKPSKDPVYLYNLDFNYISDENWRNLFKIEKKVFIQSKDVHSVFVSSAFLKEKNILPKVVSGGELKIYQGEFIGVLKDRAVENIIPIRNRPFVKEYVKLLEEYFLERGITAVVNFDCDMLNEKDLLSDFKLRVVQGIYKDDVSRIVKEDIKSGDGDNHFKIGPVKLFLDGSLGSQTAWMFHKRPFKGITQMGEDELKERVNFADKNGLQVAVHAIGSGATYTALKVFKNSNNWKVKHRIEHLQLIEEEHIEMLKESNFIASMQPIHAISDYELYIRYLKGFRYAYPWKTVKDSSKMLVFGSDSPVDEPSFLKGIYAAITRKTLDKGLSYLEEETIDIISAIDAYTINGYNSSFLKDIGEIKEGKIADFIVLEKSLFKDVLFEEDFLSNRVIKTFIDGREVWTI